MEHSETKIIVLKTVASIRASEQSQNINAVFLLGRVMLLEIRGLEV